MNERVTIFILNTNTSGKVIEPLFNITCSLFKIYTSRRMIGALSFLPKIKIEDYCKTIYLYNRILYTKWS